MIYKGKGTFDSQNFTDWHGDPPANQTHASQDQIRLSLSTWSRPERSTPSSADLVSDLDLSGPMFGQILDEFQSPHFL